MAPRIIVTGGKGMFGRAVITELLKDGFEVLAIDRSREGAATQSWVADLRNPAVMMQAAKNCSGIVHLAAHIAPNLAADHETYIDNVTMTYNVLNAAHLMSVHNVVIASSTAAYGFLYGAKGRAPDFLPITESHRCLPTDPYGQSKVTGEMLAESFAEKGIENVISLRFPGINYDATFKRIEGFMSNPGYRAPGFWSYVDVRDASRACLVALKAQVNGHRIYNVAARDSNMRQPTEQLIREHFPDLDDVRVNEVTNWSGVDSRLIEQELGFAPNFSWQDVLLSPHGR